MNPTPNSLFLESNQEQYEQQNTYRTPNKEAHHLYLKHALNVGKVRMLMNKMQYNVITQEKVFANEQRTNMRWILLLSGIEE